MAGGLSKNGEFLRAITDFSALLTKEQQHGHYYSDVALLHRAFVYYRLHRDGEAVADLLAIPEEDCITNIGGDMVSKRVLLGHLQTRAGR